MELTRFVVHDNEIRKLMQDPAVMADMSRWGAIILARAKGRVRVRTGRARRGIVLRAGRDTFGVYVDVVSTARGNNGYPYAAKLERRRPYLRPSIPGRTLG